MDCEKTGVEISLVYGIRLTLENFGIFVRNFIDKDVPKHPSLMFPTPETNSFEELLSKHNQYLDDYVSDINHEIVSPTSNNLFIKAYKETSEPVYERVIVGQFISRLFNRCSCTDKHICLAGAIRDQILPKFNKKHMTNRIINTFDTLPDVYAIYNYKPIYTCSCCQDIFNNQIPS